MEKKLEVAMKKQVAAALEYAAEPTPENKAKHEAALEECVKAYQEAAVEEMMENFNWVGSRHHY